MVSVTSVDVSGSFHCVYITFLWSFRGYRGMPVHSIYCSLKASSDIADVVSSL